MFGFDLPNVSNCVATLILLCLLFGSPGLQHQFHSNPNQPYH